MKKKKFADLFISFIFCNINLCCLFFVFVFMLSATSHITLHLWEWVKWQSKSKLANKCPDQRAAYAWLFQFWASTKCSFSRVYLQEQIHLYSFCNFLCQLVCFFFLCTGGNVLVDETGQHVKLADFGTSIRCESFLQDNIPRGTEPFMSPEVNVAVNLNWNLVVEVYHTSVCD